MHSRRSPADATGSLFSLSASAPRTLTDGTAPCAQIIGGDNALAYLDTSGYIHILLPTSEAYDAIATAPTTRSRSMGKWADVVASETAILGLTPDGHLYRFPSLDAILCFDGGNSSEIERIALPPLPVSTFRLYALETRLFIHVAGAGMQQLLELVRGDDDLGQGLNLGKKQESGKRTYSTAPTSGQNAAGREQLEETRLVSIDVDALSFTIVPGPKNRLGVLCDTGEAYLLDSRTRDLERLDIGAVDGKDIRVFSSASLETGFNDASHGMTIDDDADTADYDSGSDDQAEPETRLIGIGSGFEVVVRDDGVWTRGASTSALSLRIMSACPSYTS